MTEAASSVVTISTSDDVHLLPKERRKLLHKLGQHFFSQKDRYMRGEWKLSEEIHSIPSKLWATTILEMASNRQFAACKVQSSSTGTLLLSLFPISNARDVLLCHALDQFAQKWRSKDGGSKLMSRSEFLLCLRVLKILEQVVFSRSRLCVGPLQATISLAGILEHSASWTCVMNSLGISLSYDSSEMLRKNLIAERERADNGAFSDVNMEARIITVQIDNFDILPYHSVKAAGKALPMISRTPTQSIIHSKRTGESPSVHEHHKNNEMPRLDGTGWLPVDAVPCLSNRSAFVSSLHSENDKNILNDFMDLCFGTVLQDRSDLLGVSETTRTYKRSTQSNSFKHQGTNFRTLLLSCFKPHGGLSKSHPSLYDQDILFVDISRLSAADILTIHQKLSMLEGLLKSGRRGGPTHVIVTGDQPTYRMLVRIWRKSFLEHGRSNSTSNQMDKGTFIYEWLIPFPGFFHIEKQSLYPLCKEILHGLGLKELAEVSGLSASQLNNISHYSHARNNRAVLFNICAALLLHVIDIVQAENPDLKDSIDTVLAQTCNDMGGSYICILLP